ncbi:transmembrane protein, putative [Bodo saltans]|uniref:Transmembrane protein, putative n=1 Tax=Bodo saltans TaxID=75058 RepID=A0A0S4IJY9_BODSA|nr:transmembrane protein, putative [Bodo saltans]|eukprot:CUE97823.1 transmembrane protein, putative [Bodo saltans]
MGTVASSNYVDGVVACPQMNITAPPWSGNLSSVLLTSQGGGGDPSSSSGSSGSASSHPSVHMTQLLAALDTPDGRGVAVIGGGSAAPFPFASTSVLYGMFVLETLLCVVVITWRYHGLRLLVAKGDGSVGRERCVTPPTDNHYWKIYFLSNFFGHLIALLVLQVPAIQNSAEAMRIMILLQRCMLGSNCLALAFALNHQRIHRVKEHRKQKGVSPELIRQVTVVNRVCAALFLVFCITDFVSNHVVDALSDVANYFYWAYVVMLGILNIPVVIAVMWIDCHEAPIQASRFSKCLVTLATAIHLVVVLPPTFWSEYAFNLNTTGLIVVPQDSITDDACPLMGGHMSKFDLVVIANICSIAMYFAFVALEHRRNRLIGQTDHYHSISQALEGGQAHHNNLMINANSNPASSRGSELTQMLNDDDDAIVEVPLDDGRPPLSYRSTGSPRR